MSGPPRPKSPPKGPKVRQPLKRTAMKRKPVKSKAEFHPSVRVAIALRSRGKCEACAPGCTRRATVIHHRRRRSQGGGADVDNGLHVCNPCHLFIHANVELAIRNGWLLLSSPSPGR